MRNETNKPARDRTDGGTPERAIRPARAGRGLLPRIRMMPEVSVQFDDLPNSTRKNFIIIVNNLAPIIIDAWKKRPAGMNITDVDCPLHEEGGERYWWGLIKYTRNKLSGPLLWLHSVEELSADDFLDRYSRLIKDTRYELTTVTINAEDEFDEPENS